MIKQICTMGLVGAISLIPTSQVMSVQSKPSSFKWIRKTVMYKNYFTAYKSAEWHAERKELGFVPFYGSGFTIAFGMFLSDSINNLNHLKLHVKDLPIETNDLDILLSFLTSIISAPIPISAGITSVSLAGIFYEKYEPIFYRINKFIDGIY